MLVVIPCGGKKMPGGPYQAQDLYTGPYFRACLRAALAETADRSQVRILSGKWGLLRLTDTVAPYEQRIDGPGAVSLETVREQATTQGILAPGRVLALCAGPYVKIVRAVWPDAETPLVGVGGIGYQLSVLKGMYGRPGLW